MTAAIYANPAARQSEIAATNEFSSAGRNAKRLRGKPGLTQNSTADNDIDE